ncbi:MAG TPA: sensor histidine kinase [Aquihabitans sp.]|nr:sensor histidine kinase [Aquihabitans sp.]
MPDRPEVGWRDRALVVAMVPIGIAEAVVQTELVWRWLSLAVFFALLAAVHHRRAHPLGALVGAFALLAAVDVASLVAGVDWRGLGSNIVVLLLPYALLRWGAARDAVLGYAVMTVPAVLSGFDDQIHRELGDYPAGNIASGLLVLVAAGAVGMAVRFRETSHEQQLDQAKLLEREQLARELHDTVAHHMSAIAIRAQAGRVVGASDPAGAVDALRVIEEEASRTLAEMRTLVGALRQRGEADLSPQRGVADIERLAGHHGDRPRIEVELSGDLDGLRPSVDAALYRLAQEAITNAVRHARHASRVHVAVRGEPDCIRLTVGDDGDTGSFDPRSSSGFGLVGMAERAKLLGGTLDAGPSRTRGWTVAAVLPRAAATS